MSVHNPTLWNVWMTAAEAAAYLKVKPRTLLLWVRQGKINAFALSGTRRVWRFRRSDLDAAVMQSPVRRAMRSTSTNIPRSSWFWLSWFGNAESAWMTCVVCPKTSYSMFAITLVTPRRNAAAGSE